VIPSGYHSVGWLLVAMVLRLFKRWYEQWCQTH
jgi:hypothetical protein